MNKLTVSTAVFALSWATSAHAQVMAPAPAPEQAQPQYGQPVPAPTPYGYPPPAQYNPSVQAPAPYAYEPPPGSNSNAPPAAGPDRSAPGFHIALGLGFAGGGPQGRPGIATQFKIGARLSPSLTLYYYGLNNWYKTVRDTYAGQDSYWRICAVDGVGVDYFFVPKLGLRTGLGLSSDLHFSDYSSSSSKSNNFGYAYFMGLTWEILDSRSHLSIDPVINVVQLKSNSTWYSDAIFLLTVNWVYN